MGSVCSFNRDVARKLLSRVRDKIPSICHLLAKEGAKSWASRVSLDPGRVSTVAVRGARAAGHQASLKHHIRAHLGTVNWRVFFNGNVMNSNGLDSVFYRIIE